MKNGQLGRRLLAEFLGAGLLVTAVVGSGVAASRLSPGDAGLQLLENAAATAAALIALILCLGPVSGAHFNPVVTLADLGLKGISVTEALCYMAAQVTGGILGALVANGIFGLATFELSEKARTGGPIWSAEAVATFGLILVILGLVRSGRPSAAPYAVGAYIGAAYFFTSSTSFANPAVTVGRMFSNSFAGIKPSSAPAFIGFQLIGGALAVAVARILYHPNVESAANVVIPHPQTSVHGAFNEGSDDDHKAHGSHSTPTRQAGTR